MHSPLITLLLSWQLFFSPNGGAENAIVRSIDSAKKHIRVQAYSFTSKPIAEALIRAKDRGCDISIILDRTQRTARGSQYQKCAEKIPVRFDTRVRIQHNKVIIIDSARVITGSFNFSNAAERSNAENLLILDDRKLSIEYLTNWNRRYKISQ
jgi:phosphatidylserine/phosphatidylglycerophosphate/cardiolipin synthase-like enzyme